MNEPISDSKHSVAERQQSKGEEEPPNSPADANRKEDNDQSGDDSDGGSSPPPAQDEMSSQGSSSNHTLLSSRQNIMSAECAIVAMANFRTMSTVFKSKKKLLEGMDEDESEVMDDILETRCEADEVNAEKKEAENKKEVSRSQLANKEEIKDNNKEEAEEEVFQSTTSSRLKFLRKSIQECSHHFEEHSFGAPTYCNICEGLLVGLWSQGLQCTTCGMNVHRGEGIGSHDDCHAEALLTPCANLRASMVLANEPHVNMAEALSQVRQLAQNNQHFFSDIGQQMDRDIKARAKEVIVAQGVEDQRSKKLRRTKAWVVSFVESVDAVEARGEVYVFLFLWCFKALFALAATAAALAIFIIALWPRHGLLTDTAIRLAAVHNATVFAVLYALLLLLAFVLCRLAHLFKRKVNIIDQFLRDEFQIDAQIDFGISVAGAAKRARAWSDRIFVSSALSCVIASSLWHAMQPTSWDPTTLPPLAAVAVAATVLLISVVALSLLSYRGSYSGNSPIVQS